MPGRVIGMGVADEGQLLLRPVRIQPEAQAREINPALEKLKFKRRHAGRLGPTDSNRKTTCPRHLAGFPA